MFREYSSDKQRHVLRRGYLPTTEDVAYTELELARHEEMVQIMEQEAIHLKVLF
jgi:hypothetical protein